MGITECEIVIETKIMTKECINYINPYQTKTEDIIFYVVLLISFLINCIYIYKSKKIKNNKNKIRKDSKTNTIEEKYQDLEDYNNECMVCLETNKKLKKISCKHILCVECFKKLKNKKYNECPMCKNIINEMI